MADAQDSGSCEQYAHVGSSPVPRTTKPRYSIGCAEVLFLWHIRSRRDLNGRKRQQSIRIVAPPRRDSADNATLHGRFVILCRARNYYRLSSGASPVPRTTKPRYSIGCAEALFLWRIRLRRDLNGATEPEPRNTPFLSRRKRRIHTFMNAPVRTDRIHIRTTRKKNGAYYRKNTRRSALIFRSKPGSCCRFSCRG